MYKKLHDQKKATRIQFTEAGYQAAQKEHDEVRERRKEVLIELQRAREMGDLSENGAYKAARWELGGIDRRIRQLTYQLRAGKVVKPTHSGEVAFGSKVEVMVAGKLLVYELVNGYESDPRIGKLSVFSPLGKKFLGKKAGDLVRMTTRSGKTVEYEIISIT